MGQGRVGVVKSMRVSKRLTAAARSSSTGTFSRPTPASSPASEPTRLEPRRLHRNREVEARRLVHRLNQGPAHAPGGADDAIRDISGVSCGRASRRQIDHRGAEGTEKNNQPRNLNSTTEAQRHRDENRWAGQQQTFTVGWAVTQQQPVGFFSALCASLVEKRGGMRVGSDASEAEPLEELLHPVEPAGGLRVGGGCRRPRACRPGGGTAPSARR